MHRRNCLPELALWSAFLLVLFLTANGAPAAQTASQTDRVILAVPVPDGLSERVAVTLPGGDSRGSLNALRDAGAYRILQVDETLAICQLSAGAHARVLRAFPRAELIPVSEIPSRVASGNGALHPLLRAYANRDRTPEPARHVGAMSTDHVELPSEPAAASVVSRTSEMMVGDVLLQVILVEHADPWNMNHWTDSDFISVLFGLVKAASAFQDASPVNINFVFQMYKRVPVRSDPIQHDRFSVAWIHDAMTALGDDEPNATAAERVNAFNESALAAWNMDWATTVFIANSVNDWDGDHLFRDSRVPAFGLLGGPYSVTTYPTGWLGRESGIERSMVHELGRLFWGLEENTVPSPGCDIRSGYLNFENGNKTVKFTDFGRIGCGHLPQVCTMNTDDMWGWQAPPEVCRFTRGMFGFVDENENGAPDAFDIAPLVEFAGALSETLTTQPGKQAARVFAQSLPNNNSQQPEEGRRRYAAPMDQVSVKVTGLQPYILTNDDLRAEVWPVDFILPTLVPGVTNIDVTAENTFGVASPVLTKRLTYVDLRFTGVSTTHEDDGIRIEWTLIGKTFDARFRVARRDVNTGHVVFVADVAREIERAHGFTTFAMVDRATVPGDDYEYTVVGKIEMPHRGSQLVVERESGASGVRGGVVRSLEQNSLRVAPNPFRSKVWVSIDLNASPQLTTGADPAVSSPSLAAAVYSVNGARVATLNPRLDGHSMATFSWDGRHGNGRRAAAGVYFIRANVDGRRLTRKVLLLR